MGRVALPFTSLRLVAPRPRALPRGYPTSLSTLGDHIRRRRLDLGLMQRTVAEQLGVRVETVGLWEKGRAQPLPQHHGLLLAFLGYDPEPVGEGVPARLNAARRELGLTLAQLAEWTGFDEGSLTRWLNQSRHPSPWMAGNRRLAPVVTGGGQAATTICWSRAWRRSATSAAKCSRQPCGVSFVTSVQVDSRSSTSLK